MICYTLKLSRCVVCYNQLQIFFFFFINLAIIVCNVILIELATYIVIFFKHFELLTCLTEGKSTIEFRMPISRILVKYVLVVGFWLFFIFVIVLHCFERTSSNEMRVFTLDVLTDNRTGKLSYENFNFLLQK